MGIHAETLAALVAKWIIANEDNGANQSQEQRRGKNHDAILPSGPEEIDQGEEHKTQLVQDPLDCCHPLGNVQVTS